MVVLGTQGGGRREQCEDVSQFWRCTVPVADIRSLAVMLSMENSVPVCRSGII